ncbi:MAG: hypothetical protein WCX28_07790 [Bacteriovoracaceae bacterium]|nr:hypothetical protein [Bacteroidota bacterium]
MGKTDYSTPLFKAQTASLSFGLFVAAGILFHEILHSLSWMLAGKLSFTRVKFSF